MSTRFFNYATKLVFILMLLFLINFKSSAKDSLALGESYSVRLLNGDILSGELVEFVNSPDFGEGIKIKTEIGRALVYLNQMAEIKKKKDFYRHTSRVYLMPTGEAIKENHYIADFEAAMLVAGVGVQNWLSIMAGRSVIPSIRSDEQVNLLNVKATVVDDNFDFIGADFYLGLGFNYASINNNNALTHGYFTATLKGDRTRLTLLSYFKLGSKDIYTLKATNIGEYNMYYANGTFGIGVGIDTKFTERSDLHFIGEIWNANVIKPRNTGLLLGLRLCNTAIASDFGIGFSTAGAVIPVIGVSWTPFE